MELREKIVDALIDAEAVLWSVKRVLESPHRISREDISNLRTLLEVVEGKLKEADGLFEELAFQTPLKLEVYHG